MSNDTFMKIIVVGDQCVGKTCILSRYTHDKFNAALAPTIGMDFQLKQLKYQGRTIRLQLWDIAGQERYSAVSKLYVRGAYCAVIVTDVNTQTSLQSSLKWKKMIEESCDWKDGKPIPMILVQNKFDELKCLEEIEPFQTQSSLGKFAAENGFSESIQTSAKDNYNIQDLFYLVIESIIASGILANKLSNDSKQSNFARPNTQPVQQSSKQQQRAVKLNNNEVIKNNKAGGKTCC